MKRAGVVTAPKRHATTPCSGEERCTETECPPEAGALNGDTEEQSEKITEKNMIETEYEEVRESAYRFLY